MTRLGASTLPVIVFLVAGVGPLYGQTPAPSPTPKSPTVQTSPFKIQAKVLRVGKGWVRVEVLKVTQGNRLKAHDRLRVIHSANTIILMAGKAASLKDLTAGRLIAITGTIGRSSRALTYQAVRVTIER